MQPVPAPSSPSRSRSRRELAKKVCADFAYDPREVVAHEVLLEHSRGEGFNFHVEAAGAPHLTIPEMEKALAINAKVVQIGRAAQRVPMYLESLQVRRAQAYGRQDTRATRPSPTSSAWSLRAGSTSARSSPPYPRQRGRRHRAVDSAPTARSWSSSNA